MAELWSAAWFDAVNEAASVLEPVSDVSFSFDVEIAETANGKVRGHGHVTDGRLTSFVDGKFVGEKRGDKPDVSFVGKAKRLLPIVRGEQPALVAYMLGELKVDGEYHLVVDHLASRSDRVALESFRSQVSAATD